MSDKLPDMEDGTSTIGGQLVYAADVDLTVLERVYREIRSTLGNVDIQHIGSTAITGAITKGDIDICVRLRDTERALEALAESGFKRKADTHQDEELFALESSEFPNVGIQLVKLGGRFDIFVAFRDQLNRTPELVFEYNKVKHENFSVGKDDYQKRKREFVARVLATLGISHPD